MLAYCKFAPNGEVILIEPVGVPQVGCVTFPVAIEGKEFIVNSKLSETVEVPVTVMIKVTLPVVISEELGVYVALVVVPLVNVPVPEDVQAMVPLFETPDVV